MDRFLNKQVVITLDTGVGVKGIPVVWNDKEVVITYPDSDNYTVIFNPSENIMMVSVYEDLDVYEDPVRYASDLVAAGEPDPEYDEIVEPETELDHFESDPTLRALKLADLHLEKKRAIKEQLNNHFKQRVARMPQAPAYDAPDFTK